MTVHVLARNILDGHCERTNQYLKYLHLGKYYRVSDTVVAIDRERNIRDRS